MHVQLINEIIIFCRLSSINSMYEDIRLTEEDEASRKK